MTRPLDASARRPGFDGPPDERAKGIDVIGSAESIAIPAIRKLLALSSLRSGPFGSSEDKDRLDILHSAVRENLKLPIWGSGTEGVSGLRQISQDASPASAFTGVDLREEDVLHGAKNQVVENSFIFGDYAVLSGAQMPHVKDSLIVGGEVLSGDDDAATFTSDHLGLLLEITDGVREGDLEKVKSVIRKFEMSGYINNMYRHLDTQDGPYSQYGNYATVAKAIDDAYLPALQKGETVDAYVENSIVFGRHAALRNVLGGRIKDSIIVGGRILPDAHVYIDNCWLISESGELYVPPGGRQGSPGLALEAAAAVRDLPPNPLFSM